jgi:hypothetical protein
MVPSASWVALRLIEGDLSQSPPVVIELECCLSFLHAGGNAIWKELPVIGGNPLPVELRRRFLSSGIGGYPASVGPQIGPAPLGGHRITYTYNGDGVEIENIIGDFVRRLRLGDSGEPVVESEYSHRQHVHFKHVFDARGNWTERVTWVRTEPNPNSQPSGIERREINYS